MLQFFTHFLVKVFFIEMKFSEFFVFQRFFQPEDDDNDTCLQPTVAILLLGFWFLMKHEAQISKSLIEEPRLKGFFGTLAQFLAVVLGLAAPIT